MRQHGFTCCRPGSLCTCLCFFQPCLDVFLVALLYSKFVHKFAFRFLPQTFLLLDDGVPNSWRRRICDCCSRRRCWCRRQQCGQRRSCSSRADRDTAWSWELIHFVAIILALGWAFSGRGKLVRDCSISIIAIFSLGFVHVFVCTIITALLVLLPLLNNTAAALVLEILVIRHCCIALLVPCWSSGSRRQRCWLGWQQGCCSSCCWIRGYSWWWCS